MSAETYAIVFKGDIVAGFEAATVKAQLSKLLKLDEKKAAALFSGKQIVLKKTTDKTAAAKYGKALKKVGADVKIKIVRSDAATPAAKPAAKPTTRPKAPDAAQAPAAPVFQKAEEPVFQKADDAPPPAFQAAEDEAPAAEAADTSAFTLAPNEGDLFDPQPDPESPALDLSEYSVAENDGSPLVEAEDADLDLDIDLSAFSLKDNDGSPLVEASSANEPVVDAPDFGLDEPGAVLETLQEEKELLTPNTIGITLAMPGEDLVDDTDKNQGPPPVSPDTSKINLVPNFDI